MSKGSLERDFLDIYLTMFSESVISDRQKLWGSSFFRKGSKIQIDFKNSARSWEQLFRFSDNCIWIGIVKLSLLRTGYFPLVVNVLKSSPKILACQEERRFPTQFIWQWSMIMIKVLWSRFQQCLCPFTMLLVEASSGTRLFRHLSKRVIGVRNFENTKGVRVIFFFKRFKILGRFQKYSKNFRATVSSLW